MISVSHYVLWPSIIWTLKIDRAKTCGTQILEQGKHKACKK
jgi:hypothetical protein